MPEGNGSVETLIGVPEMMYQSFRLLNNPRKLMIFNSLCKARGKLTTKDIELELQNTSEGETLGYIADTLRELEGLKLAKYLGDEYRSHSREGDWRQTFKCYEATEHGQYLYTLCKTYDPERPLANLGGALEPERVVDSFSKLKKEELNLVLDKFRDVYLLGGTLISLYYQKHESASSRWLSDCLYGRLSKDEVEKFLANYAGSDSLVIAHPIHRSAPERALDDFVMRIAGKERVTKWMSKLSYSLTPEGKRIAQGLAEEFYPQNLGVSEEYLRPEKIEAEDGVLGRSIALKFISLFLLIGFAVYGWLDLFRELRVAPSNTVVIGFDLLLFLTGFLGSIFYGIFRLPGIATRIVYWRKLRRQEIER